MRKTTLAALVLAVGFIRAAGAQTSPALPAEGSYSLDPPHTFAWFSAQHMVVGRVRGRFDSTNGTITVSKDLTLCSVDVTIDASSLSTQNSVRDADVKGPDYFDVVKYPAVTYRGRGIRKSGDGWTIDGTLTIRGIARVVPLSFQFNGTAPAKAGQPSRVAFHATAAVKRADFGMTKELLDEIGKVSSKMDVWLEIDAEALGAKPTSSSAHPPQ